MIMSSNWNLELWLLQPTKNFALISDSIYYLVLPIAMKNT